MLDAAHKLIAFTANRTRQDLDTDEILALALVRLLEILGEAAKAVPESIKSQRPDVPWRAIAGTRDRLIHNYFEVDLDIVWRIVQDELPSIVPALESLLLGLPPEAGP
jgi:uncharacterized protein with HEPN domain